MGLAADIYARMQAKLLPPGKLWRLIGDALLPAVLLGSSDELARLDARGDDLINESDPRTAVELLPEYESEFDIEAVGTTAQRQATITARTIADQGFRPVDVQATLAPLLGQLPAAVVIIERTHADAVALGDARLIYQFYVYRDPALAGTYYLDQAQALLDEIKFSHTNGKVIESTDFLYDDPHSLYDRDLLGA